MSRDKEICKELGICWHEWDIDIYHPTGCSCGKSYFPDCPENPDFTEDAGKVQLLREIGETGRLVELSW